MPRTLVFLVVLLLATACSSDDGVTARFDRMQRLSIVSSGVVDLDGANPALRLTDFEPEARIEISYATLGHVVRRPRELTIVVHWSTYTFMPDFSELVIRGNGKRLRIPVMIKSNATRGSRLWDARATGRCPPDDFLAVFPEGQMIEVQGVVESVYFVLTADVRDRVRKMLAMAGTTTAAD